MSDPERWLSGDGEGDALERDLLASLRKVDPPDGAKAVAWDAVAARVAGAAVLGTAAATGLRGAILVLKAAATKVALGVALAGATVGGVAVWVHVRAASRVAHGEGQRPVHAEGPGPAIAPEASEGLASVPVIPERSPSPSAPAATRATPDRPHVDRLGAESALLTEARAELRRGDVTAAQATLTRMQAAFPNGVLGQEREVLAIEVLAASGKTDAARRRARAFIEAHPESPHSTTLGHLLDDP
jgi:Outer membrane lipoprotein